MTADRDTTRIVRSWLRSDERESGDRVLQTVMSRLETTPQRRSMWPPRRFAQMNKFVPATLAAAAVVIVAVVGYNLLPRSNQVGPPAQTTTIPSPGPAPLAVGNFTSHGASTQLDASGDGAAVTGSMTLSDDGGSISVDLGCARTTDGGLVMIGGPVSDSTNELALKGSRLAIILERGSPVKALFWFQHADPAAASCTAFLESIPDKGETGLSGLEQIAGTLDLRP